MLIPSRSRTPSWGQRKARHAAPKPASPRPKNVTMPRLKNWRRVTPRTSGSGGTHGDRRGGPDGGERLRGLAALDDGGPLDLLARGRSGLVAARARRRTRGRACASRAPARRWPRRCRAGGRVAKSSTPARTTRTGMAMSRAVVGSMVASELHEQSPSFQGKMKLKPGPRKNVPIITSTAQYMRNIVIREMANFRSSGLLLGFRSVYGARISPTRAMPGRSTPATIGWNHLRSSCRPRKYHGALEGFGVWLTLASSRSGALTNTENTSRNAVHAEGGHELDDEQVRPHVDLVLRQGLDVLDRAGLHHRQEALGVPAGAGGERCRDGRRGRGHASARGRGDLGGGGVAALRLGLGGLRPLEEVRRDLALCALLASPGASPPASRCARLRRRSEAEPRPWPAPLRLACGGAPGSRSCRFASLDHSGPEMPPSLRTRQKWIAMKMTITNGSIRTWSTYQRRSVSVPISAPPRSTKRTWFPKTGV